MSRTPWVRALTVAAVAIGLFAVLNIGLLVVNALAGGPSGPASSSYAVGPTGLSGYAALLRRAGHAIERWRTPLGIELPSANSTIVVLDARQLDADDAGSLESFVNGGGRLVIGGRTTGPWLASFFGTGLAPIPVGPIACKPSVAAPETLGVAEVESDGKGAFADAGPTEPILGCGDQILATVASPGAGRVVFLADAALLDNRLLAVRDNAAFGLDVAGPAARPVVFVEYVHGFRAARGLAALPLRAKVAIAGLVLALCLLLWARSSRPGRPNDGGPGGAPTRLQHVEAVGAIVADAGSGDTRADLVRGAARRAVRLAASLAPDASTADIRTAAERLGVPAEEAAAIVGRGGDPRDVLLAGRGLARLNGRRGGDY